MSQMTNTQWIQLLNEYYAKKEIPYNLINRDLYSLPQSIEYLEYSEDPIYRDIPNLHNIQQELDINYEIDNICSNSKKLYFDIKWLKFLPPLICRQNAFQILYF